VRRDHRPYIVKKAFFRFQHLYARHFLVPQFESIGKGYFLVRPWHVEVFGPAVTVGDYVNILAASDLRVRISVWSTGPGKGGIRIGHYCLISPGVRISSSCEIRIDNCMIANGVYITDSTGTTLQPRRRRQVGSSSASATTSGSATASASARGDDRQQQHRRRPRRGGRLHRRLYCDGNPARVVKTLDAPEVRYPGELVCACGWLFRQMDRFDRDLLISTWGMAALRLVPTRVTD
jgi:acetyltransferase-like isoleucine patch superfamily enzyme